MPSLADRVVLITGGASGIGAAFVRAFAAQGRACRLPRHRCAGGRGAGAEVRPRPAPRPCSCPATCSTSTPCARRMAEVHGTLGDAAVLVNNAANDQRQVLAEVTPAEFDWTIGVNLKHVFFAAQAVVPQMQARWRRLDHQHVVGRLDARRAGDCRSTPRRRRRSSASPIRWPASSAPTASASTRSRRGW